MPITPTYPGVYIEELPSGVRTISGVATSITAFVGRALRGPVSEPTQINNFGDFERLFGGLQINYPISYAVRDFYQNGGSQALIVRLFSDDQQKAAQKTALEVVTATEDAAKAPGATPAIVGQAARSKANTIAQDAKKTDVEKAAANQVAKAAEDAAATQGATPDSVSAAATAASKAISVASPKAEIRIPAEGTTTAKDVVTAAEDAAKAPGATLATIAQAARSKANEIAQDAKKTDVEKAAANQVAKAAEDAAAAQGATPDSVKAAAAAAIPQTFSLEAASPGKWGNNLKVSIDYESIDGEVADRYGLDKKDLLNLTVTEGSGAPERIRNVSVVEGRRRLDRVLEQESQLVRVSLNSQGKPNLPLTRPEAVTDIKAEALGRDGGLLETTDYQGSEKDKTGLFALEKADLFNLLCIPPDSRDGDTDPGVYDTALNYCVKRRAMLIVDPPAAWGANKETAAAAAKEGLTELKLTGTRARNAALYFPRVIQADPLREGQLDTFVPCGIVAGIMSRTDTQRGVWKAPAGIDAALSGIQGLQVELSNDENGMLNPLGINCLRNFPPVYGRVVWGARTLRGADQLADEYKYVPVRRLLLFLQESLYRGTQWVVFEPNDEPLWAQIRLNIGAFMNNLFRQGAFQGKSPKDAYFVKCDSETTTQNDINLGIVNIIVGFAPLKPAEFVILKFQQITGQIAT